MVNDKKMYLSHVHNVYSSLSLPLTVLNFPPLTQPILRSSPQDSVSCRHHRDVEMSRNLTHFIHYLQQTSNVGCQTPVSHFSSHSPLIAPTRSGLPSSYPHQHRPGPGGQVLYHQTGRVTRLRGTRMFDVIQ